MTAPETRIVLRPLASPLALGFLGLAAGAVITAGLDLGWIASSESKQAGVLILAFTPVPQLIACLVAFAARDPAAATGMGTLSAAWTARGLSLLTTPPGRASSALGTLLLVAAAAALIAALAAATGKLVPAAVMATTATHFLLTGLEQLAGGAGLARASGIVGIALTGLALYAAASLALEDLRRETVLPTGRHGAGRRALEEDLDGQLEGVAREAGVRRQL